MLLREPRNATVRAALIVAGTACAAAGLVRGRIALRRSPITIGSADLDLLANAAIGSSSASGTAALRDVDRGESAPSSQGPITDLDGAPKGVNDLCPVTLVRVDIDIERGPIPLDASPGDRIWVEVFARGQMVGAAEVRAESGGLSEYVVSGLAQRFGDARVEVKPELAEDLLPSISVVVPTICRHPEQLVRTVRSLLDQHYPTYEVILVDNRSSSNPPLPQFEDDDRVRTVIERRPGIASARNKGISVATGTVIAFTDDDAAVDTGWLRALGTRFALDDDVDAIGGLVRPLELDTRSQLWFEEFYGGFTRSYEYQKMSYELAGADDILFPYDVGRFGAGNNMALRRSAFDRVGGFDDRLGVGTPTKGGEDSEMYLRILSSGGTVAYEPAALVRHSHRRTQRDFMTQVFSYGTGLTAMLCAIVVDDPRHLWAMMRRVPAALHLLTRPATERSTSLAPSYPRRTMLYQCAGMAYGPLALLRSVMRNRRFA
jgi:GT2 family glycosyltransferase